MELVLRGKGLWDIVIGTETTPEGDNTSSEALSKFKRRRDVAVSTNLLTIEDSCSASVINLRDPKVIWEHLKDTFQATSKASIDTYLTQYQSMRMTGDEKVMSYVNRLKILENKLAEIGHIVDDDEKRRALLKGLREEFSVTAAVIRATEKGIGKAIGELVTFEATLLMETLEQLRMPQAAH